LSTKPSSLGYRRDECLVISVSLFVFSVNLSFIFAASFFCPCVGKVSSFAIFGFVRWIVRIANVLAFSVGLQ